MGARQRIGAVMASAGWSAVTLVWVAGTILHFFTAIVAFDLAGAGLRRYVAAIAAFIFPLAGEVAVMVDLGLALGRFRVCDLLPDRVRQLAGGPGQGAAAGNAVIAAKSQG
jgi:hypothetical protein